MRHRLCRHHLRDRRRLDSAAAQLRATDTQPAFILLNLRQQPLPRLLIFAAKYLSLTAPCTPLAPRPIVAYPLLVLAAAEAVLRVRWRLAAVALALHVAVLVLVGGSGLGLCAWGTTRGI